MIKEETLNVLRGIVLIDSRMPQRCKTAVRRYFRTIELPENKAFEQPLRTHPDLVLFPYHEGFLIEQRTALCFKAMGDKQTFYFADEIFKENVVRFRAGKTGVRYPHDCALNFAMCGNFIIGNREAIHPKLAGLILKYGWKLINVKQGYAKCNICTVSDNAIITEDEGIAKSCAEYGIDVLLLKTKAVRLPGYDYGFIGGACSQPHRTLDGIKIFFCGSIEKHPEYEKIRRFCRKYDVVPESLTQSQLTDCGSILPLVRRIIV